MIEINKLNIEEAKRYLGIKGQADILTEELFIKAEKDLLKIITPKYLFSECEKESCPVSLIGEDIKEHLSNSTHIIVFCATLGSGVDAFIRKAQVSDMAMAVVADSLASSAVEQLCDIAEVEIKKLVSGKDFTFRYSAGYGDFPLETQRELLLVLNARNKIGLSITETLALTPTKSVTALIGFRKD